MRAEMNVQSYPWYIQDWFISDARARLSLEERGLYREILDLLYHHGGFIEDDPDILQRKIGCKEKEFLRAWPKVKACFETADDGRLCHGKVLETISKVAAFKQSRSEAGRRGAEKKWNGSAMAQPSKKTGSAIKEPMAKDSLLQSYLTPSYTPAEPSPENGIDHNAEFVARWERWPPKGRTRQPLCEQRWCDVFMALSPDESRELLVEIDAGLDRWVNSQQFERGFVFGFADFLAQRRWNEQPEQVEPEQEDMYSMEEQDLHFAEFQRLRKEVGDEKAHVLAAKFITDRRRNAKAAAR